MKILILTLQLAFICFFVLSFLTFLQNLFLISEENQEPLKESNNMIGTMFFLSIFISILELAKQL